MPRGVSVVSDGGHHHLAVRPVHVFRSIYPSTLEPLRSKQGQSTISSATQSNALSTAVYVSTCGQLLDAVSLWSQLIRQGKYLKDEQRKPAIAAAVDMSDLLSRLWETASPLLQLGDLQQATNLYQPTQSLLKEVDPLFRIKHYASFGTQASYVEFVERFVSSLESLFRSFHLFVHALLSKISTLEAKNNQLKDENQHLSNALEILNAIVAMFQKQQKSNIELKGDTEVPHELAGDWKTSFDRFREIEYFKDSPDNGLQVQRIFCSLSQAGVEVPPKTVIWRCDGGNESNSESEGEVANDDLSSGYYLFKWDEFLLLLYPNKTGEISSFPGPISHEFLSEEEIIRHVQKNAYVYDIRH